MAQTHLCSTPELRRIQRKAVSELNIDAAWEYLSGHGIEEIVVHAPYIINLGNSIKPETFELAVEFLQVEIERTAACKSRTLILHPGAHVGAGTEAGIAQIVKGLNEVLTRRDTPCNIALETMAGKGSEIGRNMKSLHRFMMVSSTTTSFVSALTPAIQATAAMTSSTISTVSTSLSP